MQLFNTLTQKKEKFIPIIPRKITMYVCGPTVYNYIHIGNARSIVAFDTIRRYFEYRNYDVIYVSNFTDVDDKMINSSKKLDISVQNLADKYIKAYYDDINNLNVEPATYNPRATDNINEIIDFISHLLKDNYAYISNGNVYYRTRKFKNYGELSGQNINELENGASNHITDEEISLKEDPLDFALWKSYRDDDNIYWNSPWGKGRPGWHIECSVMASKYLGQTIDIHGGGQDLEFPHHENEIAQSEARYGEKFVHYWMHNGFVTVGDNEEKMSKSLGNFVTIHELLKKVDPQVIRFFLSSTNYRKPINYSEKALQQSKDSLNKLRISFNNLSYRYSDAIDGTDIELIGKIEEIKRKFIVAMDDDINVQNGLKYVFELSKLMNEYSEQKVVYKDIVNLLIKTFKDWLLIFGISFSKNNSLSSEIEMLIDERNEARKIKDFKKSDEIRSFLSKKGIILEDTPQGTRWRFDK